MKRYGRILTFFLLAVSLLHTVLIYANKDPIKIGFLGDFSDVTKIYCTNAYNTASIAIEEINENGGLLGRSVFLVKRDAGVDPQKHYEMFKELVNQEKVVAVLAGCY